jgi:hypothetical protein
MTILLNPGEPTPFGPGSVVIFATPEEFTVPCEGASEAHVTPPAAVQSSLKGELAYVQVGAKVSVVELSAGRMPPPLLSVMPVGVTAKAGTHRIASARITD